VHWKDAAMTGAASRLRVGTYNVYLGADLALLFGVRSLTELGEAADVVRAQLDTTDFADRARALAGILARERPDVVGLQEVTRWTAAPLLPDGGIGPAGVVVDFRPVLETALAEVGCHYDIRAVTESFSGGLPVGAEWVGVAGTNVMLVRREGGLTVTDEGTAPYRTTLDLRTGIEGVAFPIARGYGWVRGSVDGRELLVANTHIEAYDPVVRDAQRDELLAAVAEERCPVVVVGDLNARPDEVGMPGGYVDAWLAGGGDPDGGWTSGQDAELGNAESGLRERIDYVFVRGADVTACRLVGHRPEDRSPGRGLWPSDHAGVLADLLW
jgi:endonuclease/exonuclease/phosphatase family metal-dependent hydrolase